MYLNCINHLNCSRILLFHFVSKQHSSIKKTRKNTWTSCCECKGSCCCWEMDCCICGMLICLKDIRNKKYQQIEDIKCLL